jgi:hypothetical protein
MNEWLSFVCLCVGVAHWFGWLVGWLVGWLAGLHLVDWGEGGQALAVFRGQVVAWIFKTRLSTLKG